MFAEQPGCTLMLAKMLDWYRRWLLAREIRYRSVVRILDEFDGIAAANDDAEHAVRDRTSRDEADA